MGGVYRCSCLMRIVNLIKDTKVCKLGEILSVSAKHEVEFRPIILMRVDEKTSSFLICSAHLHSVLLAETKYLCTGNDIHFPELGKNYCRSCIGHYLQNMCSIYPFVVFNDE